MIEILLISCYSIIKIIDEDLIRVYIHYVNIAVYLICWWVSSPLLLWMFTVDSDNKFALWRADNIKKANDQGGFSHDNWNCV